MVKLIIKPDDIFPPQVWSSIRFLCINCKFSRCVDQVSHRNNKSFSFLDSWHGIKFEFALQISSSGRRSLFLTQLTGPLEFYYKWYLTFNLHTLFFWAEMIFPLHTMRENYNLEIPSSLLEIAVNMCELKVVRDLLGRLKIDGNSN